MKSPLALLFLFLFGLAPSSARSQSSAAPDPLFKTIQSLDTKLFDAYNHCDLTTLASLVSENLEFYHDKTGLARGRHSFIDSIKNNICGKVTRELVPGTLQVYPLAHYGAVEIGTHRFHHPGHDDEVGEAQFITSGKTKATPGRSLASSALTIAPERSSTPKDCACFPTSAAAPHFRIQASMILRIGHATATAPPAGQDAWQAFAKIQQPPTLSTQGTLAGCITQPAHAALAATTRSCPGPGRLRRSAP